MSAAEFARANVWFNPEECRVIDAMSIFHAMEKRDLEAAVRFYCSRKHHGHRAEEDVLATVDVLHAQLARYEELPQDVVGLDDFCRPRHPDWLTADGKIAWKDGAPRITFGKHNGKSLQQLSREAPDYLRWLIDKDFAEDMKKIAEEALQGRFPDPPKKPAPPPAPGKA
jgi:DNA polymerase-3 subunit epsilon